MTGFAAFPKELIVQVWRQVVYPESIGNFALTSKTICALGSNFVEGHDVLKASFSIIIRREDEADISLSATLKTLLDNPRAALYVRNVSIDWCQNQWQDSDERE